VNELEGVEAGVKVDKMAETISNPDTSKNDR
jgi:hypothetical protein